MKEEASKPLFQDFPEISTRQWEDKINSDLKGADYGKKLLWKSEEGILVKPYYREADLDGLETGRVKTLRASGSAPNSWTICQDIFPGKDLAEANEKALEALKGGAQALRFQLEKVPKTDKALLKDLLRGIALDESEISFHGFLGADALFEHLHDLAKESGADPSGLQGCLGADPLGKMATTGVPYVMSDTLGSLIGKAKEESPSMRVLDVHGGLFQEAGSNLVEELAYALSMGSEYLFLLKSKKRDLLEVVHSMQFSLSAGSNFFMEIAKFRAFRILWAEVLKGYALGEDAPPAKIHATSSRWNMTLYDPQVNMLRGTTEAMSAVLGGADVISVLPHDLPYGTTSLFTDRIARNAQIILRDEAYLDRVEDPSSGSYYIESLTEAIAEKSWDLFQQLEQAGGFRAALEQGIIQQQVHERRNQKRDRMNAGRDHLLGSNAFPNAGEFIADRVEEKASSQVTDAPLKAVRPYRLSADFEALRLETERAPSRPRVFLLKYGKPAWVSARASFSSNFFACAGYEIIDPARFSDLKEGIAQAMREKAQIIVLCSADDAYAQMVPAVKAALNGPCEIVVAGNPQEQMEELKAAGAQQFIHMKSKLLETLQGFNARLLKSS